jgi:CHASE1-domain containing sensor protein
VGDWILKWWPVIALGLGAVCWLGREAFVYFKREHESQAALERRITAQENAHQSHEDLCGQRWVAARDMSNYLVKLTDERHDENVSRFNRLEQKIDDLLRRP